MRWRGRGWTTAIQSRLVPLGAALIFALPVCGLLRTATTPGLSEGKLESDLWHTAGPSAFVSLSSVSVLPVSQHHEMGWTCRLLLKFPVKDLDKKIINYRT